MARLGGEGRAHTHGDAALKLAVFFSEIGRCQAPCSEVWPLGGPRQGLFCRLGCRSPAMATFEESNVYRRRCSRQPKSHVRTKVGRRPISRLCSCGRSDNEYSFPMIRNRLCPDQRVAVVQSAARNLRFGDRWRQQRRHTHETAADEPSARRHFSDTPSPTGFPRPPLIRLMRATMRAAVRGGCG
jgi:hypothetical protein